MNSEGSIIYYRTPRATHFFKIMAFGFFLLGGWLVLGDLDAERPLIFRIAGLISFFCFGICAWISGRRLKRRFRVYGINHDGFSLAGADGEWSLSVDWKEVQGVGLSDFGYGNVLTFAFRDPEKVKARMTEKQRKRADDNEAVGIPILTIPQNEFDINIEEIRNVSTRFFFGAG